MFITCRKAYSPPVISSGPSRLVVEGNINPGADSTIIRLTRTENLSTPSGSPPVAELGAAVAIESDANITYTLAEQGNGYYATPGLSLNPANKYKLKITTSANKAYESDFVTVKNSQPIDSVSFNALSTGVQVNVSTHDASNNSRYYRYEYEETWVIHADYFSSYEVTTNSAGTKVIAPRPVADQIFTCYTSDKSSTIVLGSTDKLSKDVLANSPVIFIGSHSEKIGTRYSILVKQFVLTKEGFDYYQQLSKNTEQLGGIFDPQPSSLTGNIHCITIPTEQVIGYITAGSVTQKRIYINKSDVPNNNQYLTTLPFDNCKLDSFYFSAPHTSINEVQLNIIDGDAIPIAPFGKPGSPPLGYTGSGGLCIDCTVRGTNKKPAFWTDQF